MSNKELSDEEKELVQQLRERVLDILEPEKDNEVYLVKWLRARRSDLDKAEEMLRKHIRFMKVNGLDKITEDFVPTKAMCYFHTAFLGYDAEGSIVRILHIGASDLRGVCLALSQTDSLRFAAYTLISDAARQKIDRANDTICDKQVCIIDLQGLAWKSIIQRCVIERAMMLLKSYEANYPENLKVAYIVNAPSFFSFIYSWLKSVLPESIITKLEIVSQEDCQSVLPRVIDPSILPASVGGTRRDPDGNPDCPSLYKEKLGGTVPESMLLYNTLDVLPNDPEAKTEIVDCRDFFKVENIVTERNSILQWDFQTAHFDIRMGLNYKVNSESESEEIIPLHRVESHRIPESGNFTCERLGIYEIVFDNTYSWMTRKELIYKIKLLPPAKDTEN